MVKRILKLSAITGIVIFVTILLIELSPKLALRANLLMSGNFGYEIVEVNSRGDGVPPMHEGIHLMHTLEVYKQERIIGVATREGTFLPVGGGGREAPKYSPARTRIWIANMAFMVSIFSALGLGLWNFAHSFRGNLGVR